MVIDASLSTADAAGRERPATGPVVAGTGSIGPTVTLGH